MTVLLLQGHNSTAFSATQIGQSARLAAVAMLCMLIFASSGPSAAADVLDSPMRVRFTLADGAAITGELTEWDNDGFSGTFGRRAWSDLVADDLWRLHRAVMDQDEYEQWINLGRWLLLVNGGERNAKRAFARAVHLDEKAKPAIDAAREAVAKILRDRREQQKRIEQQKLATDHPESRQYSTEPWPALSAPQQADNVKVMKSRANAAMERAGLEMTFIETDRFLFYSQLSPSEALRWARVLDRCYENLAIALNIDPARNIFWGKAVVMAFDDYDRFRMTEADTFNHLSQRSVHGLMHGDGPSVFLNIHREHDDIAFGELLCRLTTYAFGHRYDAPKRLPAWANEGLALYITNKTLELSTVEQLHRPFALKFVREHGNDVPHLLTLGYGDQHWPGPDNVAPAVGYLLVEMLIRENAKAFAQWVRAVKRGDDWPQALGKAYGVSATKIVERFVRWYRVNN